MPILPSLPHTESHLNLSTIFPSVEGILSDGLRDACAHYSQLHIHQSQTGSLKLPWRSIYTMEIGRYYKQSQWFNIHHQTTYYFLYLYFVQKWTEALKVKYPAQLESNKSFIAHSWVLFFTKCLTGIFSPNPISPLWKKYNYYYLNDRKLRFGEVNNLLVIIHSKFMLFQCYQI